MTGDAAGLYLCSSEYLKVVEFGTSQWWERNESMPGGGTQTSPAGKDDFGLLRNLLSPLAKLGSHDKHDQETDEQGSSAPP